MTLLRSDMLASAGFRHAFPARDASDADAAVPGMRAHFEGCPACNEDRESLRELLASEAGSDT